MTRPHFNAAAVDSAVDFTRRRWLKHSTALTGALGLGSLGSLMSSADAAADDYKALVCLFYFGGNDGMNMIVPRDATRHAQYAAVRGALALPRANLVPLDANYGLHPSMSALSTAIADGALTAVHNVGPLYAPLTKAQYRNAADGDPIIPDSLFSHSDQQLEWEAGTTSAFERTGWGGRASQVFGTTNPVISFGGNAHFGLTDYAGPWVLPGPGSNFGPNGFSSSVPVAARRTALNRLMAEKQKSPMADAYAKVMRDAFELETRLTGLFSFNADPAADPTGITNAFLPLISGGGLTTGIARQLYQVSRFVANRTAVRGTRQIFFVQMGGFDNHSDQVGGTSLEGSHADLMKQAGDGLAAFWRALKAIGMSDRVTLFTQSDFGRTFAPNESRGTDHAWGNEHLVMGAAVNGGTTHGRYPVLTLGGPDDVGVDSWELQGRWIPGTSVDQYAATLLRWWGMNESQLDLALPNLRNFGTARNVGFMRP
jgi:uncharacterized protein (DUF1501 family)